MVASFSDWRSCFWAVRSSSIVLLLALEEQGVLDGEGGVAGQRLHRLEAVGAEGGGGLLVVDVDRAHGAGRRALAVVRARRAQGDADDRAEVEEDDALGLAERRGRPPRCRWRPSRPVSTARRTTEVERPVISSGWSAAPRRRPTRTRRPATDGMAGRVRAPSTSSRKPRSARVICMTASSTCSRTWLRTRVEFRAWTRESRSCCCSIQGSSAICSVEPSPVMGENFRVTLPSWIWAPGRELAPLHARGVDVDAVEAALVLDHESRRSRAGCGRGSSRSRARSG